MKALDLFCGAGGISMGLHRAGFDVTGVDLYPQPRYPFRFFQGDALAADLTGYDLICASPPCQAYCGMQRLNEAKGTAKVHPMLIDPVREKLVASGLPYIIENVVGAPMLDPVMLCGSMFGLRVRRHRLFECSFFVLQPNCEHRSGDGSPVPVWGDGRPTLQEARRGLRSPIAVYGDHPQSPGDKTARVNRARTLKEGQEAMGIDWMDWKTLAQAIPPAFSEFLARQFLALPMTDPRGHQPNPAL